jgi:TusA-related sulfurtransferase
MIKIDCLGDFCPIPSIKAKHAYKNLKTNEKLLVLTDHSCAPANIKDVLANKDCNIQIEEVTDGIWEILIEKLD